MPSSHRTARLLLVAIALVLADVSPAAAHPGVPGGEAHAGLGHWLTSAHHLVAALAVAAILLGIVAAARSTAAAPGEPATQTVPTRDR